MIRQTIISASYTKRSKPKMPNFNKKIPTSNKKLRKFSSRSEGLKYKSRQPLDINTASGRLNAYEIFP